MGITTDRHDGCLHEIDPETGMQRCYLVLPDGERRNLVRPEGWWRDMLAKLRRILNEAGRQE